MSKANLDKILEQIASGVNSEVKNAASNSIYKYSVNKSKILKEVSRQIKDIPVSALNTPISNYCKHIFGFFRSYNKAKLIGSENSFIVILEDITPINAVRLEASSALKKDLMLYVRQPKTEDSSIDRSVLEQNKVSIDPRIELSLMPLPLNKPVVTSNVLAKLDFNMQTGIVGNSLRKGKLIATINSGDLKLRDKFKKVIRDTLRNTNFIEFEASPSVVDILTGYLQDVGQKSGFRGANNVLVSNSRKIYSSSSRKDIRNKLLTTTINESLDGSIKANVRPIEQKNTRRDWLSVMNLINLHLHDRLKQNMASPALVYRTGRFASSVRVVGVETTKRGFPSFVFDYMRDPYNVFDKHLGAQPWNTPARDPSTLINRTIREIAMDLAIDRFYLRRLR